MNIKSTRFNNFKYFVSAVMILIGIMLVVTRYINTTSFYPSTNSSVSKSSFLNISEVKESKYNSKKVLLYTYMRGGSSLLGEIFHQNKDANYWFEALDGFYQTYFVSPAGTHALNLQFHKNKTRRRDNTNLEFITSAQPAPINGYVKVSFDGTRTTKTIPTPFKFITNPRVTKIHPQSAFVSGGSVITVNGDDMDSSLKPLFFLQKGNFNSESECIAESKKTLLCPLPSLSDFDFTTRKNKRSSSGNSKLEDDIDDLNYGLKIDGWHVDLADLSYNLDLDFQPIKVYEDPMIHSFPDQTYSDGMRFEILGENLDLFNTIPGLMVTVGNTSCEILEINADKIVALAPSSPSQVIDGVSSVVVIHGNMHTNVGSIQYATVASSNVGVVVGVIFGVLIPIILVLVVLLALRRSKKKKTDRIPAPRDNGVAEKGNNIYTPPVDKEESKQSEMVPLKEMPPNGANAVGPVGSEGEEEEEIASDKPFQLSDFLERIRDPKLRSNVQEVIVPLERLDMKEMIGRGNFGCVYIADLRADHDYNACRVAVKTLQGERLEQHTVEAFLKEGVIMKNFNHPHVLKLLGVCVDNQENPMVILPYMSNGDLRTYVKDKKKNFTARQLLHLAQQVAEGMAYLSSLNFVHRDLAARNCMIDELDTVKVADFGLTRDLFEKQYFSTNLKEKRGKMPIKWMALESLEEFVFTTKSDVWSFGVLMWELMTRGVTPYPDVDIFDVRNYLASGRRLRKPKYCPENIYSIMLECWHADSDIRPSFIDLVNKIELLLNPPKRRVKEETSGEPMYVNIRKANSTEYLKPLDGGSTSEAPDENDVIASPMA